MATFTNTEKASLIEILEIDPVDLDDRLTYRETSITAEMKLKALAWIEVYETGNVSTNTTRIIGLAKNFGANINPAELRQLIAKKLALQVCCVDLVGSAMAAGGQSRLIRG